MASTSSQWNVNSLFLSSPEVHLSYGHLFGFTALLRDKLNDAADTPIRQIVLLLPAGEISAAVIASCWMLDITFVPLSTRWTRKEIQSRLNQVDCQLIISTRDVKSKFLSGKEPVLLADDNWLTTADIQDSNFLNSRTDPNPDSIFARLFTSGSSGTPKLVPLKRRQMETAAESAERNFSLLPDELWLLCLPLHHIGGISIILRSLIYGSGIFYSYPFDGKQVAKSLSENHQIKVVSLVPTMLRRLLQENLLEIHPRFKGILLGGGPVDKKLLTRSIDAGLPLYISYGMTETCAQIAAASVNQAGNDNDTGLNIFEPNECQIRGDDQRKMPAGETGLIWLKGPQVFDGYQQNELNKKAFDKSDWFLTDDYGYKDETGQLHIENRRTDIIITGGENVDVREVEETIQSIQGIKEAAVLGFADEYWGERVVAFIKAEADSKSLNTSKIRQNLQQNLARYKIPKEFIRVDALPKSGLGKIQKSKLMQLYLDSRL